MSSKAAERSGSRIGARQLQDEQSTVCSEFLRRAIVRLAGLQADLAASDLNFANLLCHDAETQWIGFAIRPGKHLALNDDTCDPGKDRWLIQVGSLAGRCFEYFV